MYPFVSYSSSQENDALKIGDRIVFVRDGSLVQVDSSEESSEAAMMTALDKAYRKRNGLLKIKI